jgi:hypothetical protein
VEGSFGEAIDVEGCLKSEGNKGIENLGGSINFDSKIRFLKHQKYFHEGSQKGLFTKDVFLEGMGWVKKSVVCMGEDKTNEDKRCKTSSGEGSRTSPYKCCKTSLVSSPERPL